MSRTSIREIIAALLCVLSGCASNNHAHKRQFSTQAAAVAHFRAHEVEFQQVAEEWLRGGQSEFCRFGTESYTWNEYRVRMIGSQRKVLHWDGRHFVEQLATSFDDAAMMAGTTPATVHYWMLRISSLSINCVYRRQVATGTGQSRYVELEFFPVLHPYGFRFAPEQEAAAQNALEAWASRMSAAPFYRTVRLGRGWFYYEGEWR